MSCVILLTIPVKDCLSHKDVLETLSEKQEECLHNYVWRIDTNDIKLEHYLKIRKDTLDIVDLHKLKRCFPNLIIEET